MNKSYKHYFIHFLLILISIFAMSALIHPGFFTGHDVWHIVARQYHFDQAIQAGQIPPRYSFDLLHGYGYPLFTFTYQLPFILAEPLVLLGVSIFDALKFVFILTYVLSGLTMYLFTRDIWGKKAGAVSAFLYLFTPYRFATILVRANLGEAVSFAFIPLVFWSIFLLFRNKSRKGIIVGGVGIAGFLLSHVMIGVLFLIPVVISILIFFYFHDSKARFIFSLLITAVFGAALSAYYLLPAIAFKPLTVFNSTFRQLYLGHFTPIKKLIYSPWGYAPIGGSGEMARQVGLVLWLVVGLSIVGIFIELFKTKKNKGKQKWQLLMTGGFILSFALAVLMMTGFSMNIWKTIEQYALIDFPWRFLAVTTFCGSVLGGFIVRQTKGKLKLWLIALLLFTAWYTNRNHLRVNKYTDTPLSLYVDSEVTTNTVDEYIPKWARLETVRNDKREPLSLPKTVDARDYRQNLDTIIFTYTASESGTIRINNIYFPGVELWVNNKLTPMKYKENDGLVGFRVEAGEGEVRLKAGETGIGRMGNAISLGILGILALFLMKRKLLKK